MTETVAPLALGQINIVVRDMQKSLAFYRLLGVSIEEMPVGEWAPWAPHHANGVTSNACTSISTASRSRSNGTRGSMRRSSAPWCSRSSTSRRATRSIEYTPA